MPVLDVTRPPDRSTGRSAWRDRFNAWVDGKLTSPGFLRWAASNVLTGWITRRRAQQVFDLMAGFVYSQVLLACVRLRILELVKESPCTLDELAQKCQVPVPALQRLIDSAVALRLLSLRGQGRYGLGALGAPVAAHAGVRAMIEHHTVLYHDMQDPVALLRDQVSDGQMAAYWPYSAMDAADELRPATPRTWHGDKVERYSQLMSASQPFVVDEVLATYDFSQHQCLLDVGGGQGTFVGRLALGFTGLKLQLFDLPQVADLAQASFKTKGIADRATAYGGDFLRGVLPTGADLVTLIRVAHDHPDAHVKIILSAIFAALPLRGTLLLAEPMAQNANQSPLGDAYFHFYLLAMGAGRLRTPGELIAMMLEAGFANVELLDNPMPLQTRILVAKKGK